MKVILSLVCGISLAYSGDSFFAKANIDGHLSYITKTNEVFSHNVCVTNINDKEAYDNCIDKKYDEVASSPEFQNIVIIEKDIVHPLSTTNINGYKCITNLYGSNSYGSYKSFFCDNPHSFYSLEVGEAITNTALLNLTAIVLLPVGGAGVAVAGTSSQYYFDQNKYNEFINLYDLERSKKTLFDDLSKTDTNVFIPCNLADYSSNDTIITSKSGCKHSYDEGLFIYNSEKEMFKEADTNALGLFGRQELEDPLKVTQIIVQRMIENYMNVLPSYPDIALPAPLSEITLEKSQFEKEADFQIRKTKVLAQREIEQKEINQKYIEAVKKRNLEILETLEERKEKLKGKISEFRKKAFAAVATVPRFSFRNYDAEHEKLFGTFSFGHDSYPVVASEVDAETAKNIFEKPEIITPQVNYNEVQNDFSTVFEMKELVLLVGRKKLIFNYSDSKYQPASMVVQIPSYDISAFKNSIADASKESSTIELSALKALQDLEHYRVKSQLAISDTEIHHVNAKAPAWYENIQCEEGNKCAVGRGESQHEALKVALAQLGCMLKSSISSKMSVERTVTDNIIESKKMSYAIQESCSNQFNEQNLEISHIVEMDGWYYVRIVFNVNNTTNLSEASNHQ